MASFVVDSHCHLDFPGLADRLPEVLARAEAAGVRLLLTISTRVKAFDRILALVEAHDNVYGSVGTHPHHAAEEPDVSAAELVTLAAHPKIVGIGEAGLDYHYDRSPREVQARSFRIHIAAAREAGLPIIIHSRAAEEDTAAILEEEAGRGAFTPLLHCFSSRAALARRGLALGGYVSFSGILTFPKSDDLRAIAREVPMQRLLVETDAPYLAPAPHRGRTNEPAFTIHTLSQLAEVKGIAPEVMAQATTENFFRLFAKVPRPSGLAAATA
jgi:TatD DNase family protein